MTDQSSGFDVPLSVAEAVELGLANATHLTHLDAPAIATLRQLAERVDTLNECGWEVDGKLDNVTVPTFLKYCESLGLTWAARRKAGAENGRPAAPVELAGGQQGPKRPPRRA